MGKNGSIPAPNISLSAIPNLPRVLMVLKLLEGKTRFFVFFFFPLVFGGRALEMARWGKKQIHGHFCANENEDSSAEKGAGV